MNIKIEWKLDPEVEIEKKKKIIKLQFKKYLKWILSFILFLVILLIQDYIGSRTESNHEDISEILYGGFFFAVLSIVFYYKNYKSVINFITLKCHYLKGTVIKIEITNDIIKYSDAQQETKYTWISFSHYKLYDDFVLITMKYGKTNDLSVIIPINELDESSKGELLKQIESKYTQY